MARFRLIFHEVAQEGDKIELRGPIGGVFHLECEPDAGPAVLLVGGGSGIVPLMSMARHRAAQHSDASVALLYGARGMSDAPYAGELQALDSANDGFRLFFAFSREAAVRTKDFSGRVNDAVIGAVLEALGGDPHTTYVCGSNRFVETVTTHLVAMGQPPSMIRTERFGGA